MSDAPETPAQKLAALVAQKKQRATGAANQTSGRAQREAERFAGAKSASKSTPWMKK
ncbi:hypothetical protein [Caulobacter sp. NIBR2454]|uniref:hypothetical protein n=1 Tax=Caulobacter sp. NIBR2454 TaxID=3015996 RepID=UPI0022B61157|nr:hypothetical protein [Caulobacter sp. NIBR2454]